MRSGRIISALLIALCSLIAASSPSSAKSYKWCSRTPSNDGMTDCSYRTFQQCQVTVSGQGGDCIRNPNRGRAVGSSS